MMRISAGQFLSEVLNRDIFPSLNFVNLQTHYLKMTQKSGETWKKMHADTETWFVTVMDFVYLV